jgi:hypothetical protein
MRIITCAGYYRTGSSAVSDLFSEFNNCVSLGDYEFRFVQDPDGISDLEYNIVENNHRHNTSHAIKRFIRLVRFLNGTWYAPRYRRFFNDMFMKYSIEYIANITELQCHSWWHRDQMDRGSIFYSLDRLYAKVIGCIQKGRSNTSMLKKEPSFFTSISREDFYKHTKEYLSKLFDYANKTNVEFMMVDQLVPPSNISRYLNYFNDIKIISVDRDPRDLYILEKTKYRWGIMPYNNVETFCEWYRITRRHRVCETDHGTNIIRINFEDLIYNYDETCKKLISFVGLKQEDHVLKKKVFNPAISLRNTKVYERHPEALRDVQYIEDRLSEYLYQFPQGSE